MGVVEDTIIAIGGLDDIGEDGRVGEDGRMCEKYDQASNTWRDAPAEMNDEMKRMMMMTRGRGRLGACVIKDSDDTRADLADSLDSDDCAGLADSWEWEC